MTLEEFQEKYCALCGTQRCLGVYDEELREGCQHYREVFLKESPCLSRDKTKRGTDPLKISTPVSSATYRVPSGCTMTEVFPRLP